MGKNTKFDVERERLGGSAYNSEVLKMALPIGGVQNGKSIGSREGEKSQKRAVQNTRGTVDNRKSCRATTVCQIGLIFGEILRHRGKTQNLRN